MSIIAHISKLNSIKNNISLYQSKISGLNSKIGNPSNLNTTAKTNVVAAVNEVNTKVSSKVDKNGTSQVRIRRETPLTSTAYNTAPFVVEIPSGSTSAPGIGFHNPNKEGAFFYLQDGKFRYMTSGGGIYEFTTERIGDAPTG